MRIPLVTQIKWNRAQDVTYEDLSLSADDAPPIDAILLFRTRSKS